MKIYKRTMMKIFFAIEIVFFIGVYLFGGNGLQYLSYLRSENKALFCDVEHLKKEVDALEKQIAEWTSNDFYKEKIAREKLQMSRKGDEIYFLERDR